MPNQTIPQRNEVAKRYTWNGESVFPALADWETAYQALAADIPGLGRYAGKLADSPATLLVALDTYYALDARLGKVYLYASMSASVDTADQGAAALVSRVISLNGQLQGAAAFIKPEILALGEQTVRDWQIAEPQLAVYAHFFDDLYRQQEHVRDAAVEEVLGLALDPFATVRSTWGLLTNADLKFAPARSSQGVEYPVFQGNIDELKGDPDREVRRTAYEHYTDGFLAFKNTLGNNLAAAIKQDVFTARVRRYSSALEASLYPNNIPTVVFHNLIQTFRQHLPTWHRYWKIRREALGLATLHPYDVRVPLTQNDPDVSFEQAVDWISDGVRPLGDDYVDILRRGCLEERWVDAMPNAGKRVGAFSSGTPDTYPFIMMSFGGDLKGMSTLAHELGHSMHSYLAWRTQPLVYCDYSLFVAEVASNFHQALVRAHLLQSNPDPQFQIAVLDEAMINFHRYFFIMPTLARWELAMHERAEQGQSLSADVMINTLADFWSEAYGGEAQFDRDREGIAWAQFNHMYANFYVFQYATGISAAHMLAQGVLTGDPSAAENYRSFLKAGGSLYPIDALKLAGVDLTTTEPVERTYAVLAGYVDRLAELTRK
jgi:oligoendopeptidase F